MKKTLSLMIAVLFMAGFLSTCSFGSSEPAADTGRIQIVTIIFPEYDWIMNILGDNPAKADVTMLLDTGVDLHSFQPTAADILKISTCDLFIYVGGESDEWVDDALQEATNKEMIVINLLDVLGDAAKEEEVVEGMQEEDHDHEEEDDEHGEGHEDHEDHDHGDGETEYDEHVWLSLKNASDLVGIISQAVQKIDPDHTDFYRRNASDYIEKLNALDSEYQEVISDASFKTVLFGDRFPFRYLTDDYGLDYYAAFVGCSAETEASFETILFLANKVDELGLKAILQIESADGKIAKTIKDSTKTKDQAILTMDSMQSTTSADVKNSVSYLSIMEKNLEVLKDALM